MALRELKFYGKSQEELKQMSIKEFAQLVPARQRRSLLKGFSDAQKSFLKKLEKKGNNVKTHCRNMIVIPQLLDRNIMIYSGKEFVPLTITVEMLGHYLGEFVMTRRKVSHNAPGIGATKSSSSISVR
ncbi:30S ribosomal protein S19 [Candidatus Woesearchaeota archaeon]|nr:30S ribosomal protein S19 [uncultured archaeon]MBS3122736.1 30S ribosomal protein S19 [Candidatus Woesearchaeota archaeon]